MATVKKKEKKAQSSADTTQLITKRTWHDFITNESFLFFPEREAWRKRFVHTMLQWAEKEDSLELVDFALEMCMRREVIYDWASKWPEVKEGLDLTRLIIGSRRRKGALTRKYDKEMALRDMHCYDPEWLEINKYHSDMKKEEEKQPTTFIINTDKPRVVSREELKGITDETV